MSHHYMRKSLISLALLGLGLMVNFTRASAGNGEDNLHPSALAVADLSSNVSVFATGLDNPRGLKFGPDGSLYVAEGGAGGTNSTVGKCDQVPAPVGPYTGSKTGARISKIDSTGTRTTVAENFPSNQTTAAAGSFISGVGDIAFMGNTLYALLSGAGCSHGVPDVPNALVKVNADGTWTQVADLSAFLKANPINHPEADDFEPDGTWYGLVAIGNTFYATEPNHQELDKITTDGKVSRVLDMSTLFVPDANWQGPTGMALGPDGNLYIGTLGKFPVSAHSKILKVTPSGQLTEVAQGLAAALDVAFDSKGQLYALEMSVPVTTPGPPVAPGTGRVVRLTSDGKLVPIATGLTLPTGMTFGSDGKIYVSNNGFGLPPGKGAIVRIDTSVTVPTTLPATGGNAMDLLFPMLALGLLIVGAGSFLRRFAR